MKCVILLGVAVACAQFAYLTTLLSRTARKSHESWHRFIPNGSGAPTRSEHSARLQHDNFFLNEEEEEEGPPLPQEKQLSRSSPEELLHFVKEFPPRSSSQSEVAPKSWELLRKAVDLRSALLHEFVGEIHSAFAGVRPMTGFGIKNSPHRSTDAAVWATFHRAVSRLLYATPKFAELRRHVRTGATEENERIFLSVSSFRDEVCADTLVHAYDQAVDPLSISVGVVQQNCDAAQHARFGCFTAVMPQDMRVHTAPPDVDCVDVFCERRPLLCANLRERGLLRVLRFNESETFGPVFGRYLGSMLWQRETYYAQVDAHTTFARRWDATVKEDYALAPSWPRAVLSHYPPSGPQKPGPLNAANDAYPWEGAPGPCMCDSSFAEYDIVRVGAMQRYPYKEHHPPDCDPAEGSCLRVPRFAPYIGAGFVFANASFLYDVPFDPFLPFAFMGEELDFSTRLWTAGWDIFCPPRSVLAHAYLRPQRPKFWGALQRCIGAGAHNSLQQFVLPRIKHKVGYPEARLLEPPSLSDHLDDFGLGTARPIADYLRIADLDFVHKRSAKVHWCKTGDRPPTAPPR